MNEKKNGNLSFCDLIERQCERVLYYDKYYKKFITEFNFLNCIDEGEGFVFPSFIFRYEPYKIDELLKEQNSGIGHWIQGSSNKKTRDLIIYKKQNKEIIGAIGLDQTNERPKQKGKKPDLILDAISILTQKRKKGYAKQIVSELFNELKKCNSYGALRIRHPNIIMQKIAKDLGFKCDEHFCTKSLA